MLRELTHLEEQELRALLESDRDLTRGRRWASAVATRAILRPGTTGTGPGRQLVLGAWIDGELLAVCAVRIDSPRPGTAHIVLLHVHADHRRRGLGRLVHHLVVVRLRGHTNVDSLSVNVPSGDDCDPFWRSIGYTADPQRRRGSLRRMDTWTRAL